MGAGISVTQLVYSAAVIKIILLCQSIEIKKRINDQKLLCR